MRLLIHPVKAYVCSVVSVATAIRAEPPGEGKLQKQTFPKGPHSSNCIRSVWKFAGASVSWEVMISTTSLTNVCFQTCAVQIWLTSLLCGPLGLTPKVKHSAEGKSSDRAPACIDDPY